MERWHVHDEARAAQDLAAIEFVGAKHPRVKARDACGCKEVAPHLDEMQSKDTSSDTASNKVTHDSQC